MKSTYKLIGKYWDGKNLYYPKKLERTENVISDIVSFKDILMAENEEDFNKLTASNVEHNAVVIDIDFWPISKNPVLISFLEKRLYQISYCLHQLYEEVYYFKNKNPSSATNA